MCPVRLLVLSLAFLIFDQARSGLLCILTTLSGSGWQYSPSLLLLSLLRRLSLPTYSNLALALFLLSLHVIPLSRLQPSLSLDTRY
ncbi:hypothetical protein QBC33DRAFT_535619 [Phialemonium atrogriseum]|uniref:Secreted protein n=1 Tax=Phialemonium atrogriseum TaxID=1093897 RepID=A0AAJ0C2D7_9PEZI|nr:uncharacterized protein QBC33DRAFT_535619 [Phialemonium atrogriseum]KAK1768631.1 hypothetical protein QBC33DRAFT_535619 [Phialemonium atrogriseum]